MDKEDARFQTLERLHERRRQVVRLHRKGIGVMRIVELSGLSYPTVRGIIDRYERGGAETIKPTLRGRQGGDGRHLTDEQERLVRQIICDKRPEQLKMEFALWNRAAVMQLIERECGVKLSVRGVGNYLKRWGFTPQKPIKKAYEQRPEAVQNWLEEEYPAIEKRAKAEGAEIHWGDNGGGEHRCAWPQLRTDWQNTGDLCGGRHAPEAVDDRHRHQPGQNTLDDY